MESIKHKMDTMVKEKDAAIEKAMGFEAETEELNKVCCFFKLTVSSFFNLKLGKPLFRSKQLINNES